MKRFLSVLVASMFLASAAYAQTGKTEDKAESKGKSETAKTEPTGKSDSVKAEGKAKGKTDDKKVEGKTEDKKAAAK
jgi:Ni/Co efflux regulator RcnB